MDTADFVKVAPDVEVEGAQPVSDAYLENCKMLQAAQSATKMVQTPDNTSGLISPLIEELQNTVEVPTFPMDSISPIAGSVAEKPDTSVVGSQAPNLRLKGCMTQTEFGPCSDVNDNEITSRINQRLCVDMLDFYDSLILHENKSNVARASRVIKCLKTFIATENQNENIQNIMDKLNNSTVADSTNEESQFSKECQSLSVDSLQFYNFLVERGNSDCTAKALCLEQYFESFIALWEKLDCTNNNEDQLLTSVELSDMVVDTSQSPAINEDGNASDPRRIDEQSVTPIIVADNKIVAPGQLNVSSSQAKPMVSPVILGKRKLEYSCEGGKKKPRFDMSSDLIELGDFLFDSESANLPKESSQQLETNSLDDNVEASDRSSNLSNKAGSVFSPCSEIPNISSQSQSPTPQKLRAQETFSSDSGTKFGIVPSKFPEMKLTEIHKSLIVDKLHEMIRKLHADKTVIKKLNLENGFIIVKCRRAVDIDWLKKHSRRLQLPGMPVDVVCDSELPLILEGIFESSSADTTEEIMECLCCQNVNLLVDEWNGLERMVNGTGDVKITFVVPQKVLEELKSVNFTVEFKFSTVRLQQSREKGESDIGDSYTEKTPADNNWFISCPSKPAMLAGVGGCYPRGCIGIYMKFQGTNDPSYIKLRQEMEKMPSKYPESVVDGGIIYKLRYSSVRKCKMFLPWAPREFIPMLLRQFHDKIGHADKSIGIPRLLNLVFLKDVRDVFRMYILHCLVCNTAKDLAARENVSEVLGPKYVTAHKTQVSLHDSYSTAPACFNMKPYDTLDVCYIKLREDIEKMPSKYPKFKVEDNVIYHLGPIGNSIDKKMKLFTPYAPYDLVPEMLKRFHDDVGHPGIHRCLVMCRGHVYFNNLKEEFKMHIRRCSVCGMEKKKDNVSLDEASKNEKSEKVSPEEIELMNEKVEKVSPEEIELKNEINREKHERDKYPNVSTGVDMKFHETQDGTYIKQRRKIEEAPNKYFQIKVEGGIIYRLCREFPSGSKIFIPQAPKNFIPQVLKKFHDEIGHPSLGESLRMLKNAVGFQYSFIKLRNYIMGCPTCNPRRL